MQAAGSALGSDPEIQNLNRRSLASVCGARSQISESRTLCCANRTPYPVSRKANPLSPFPIPVSRFLITRQNSDGGWGYHPASSSSVEATAWALMALMASRHFPPQAEVCARARQWLLDVQRADGSWPTIPGHPQGCWVTSLACQSLHLQGGAQHAVERGLQWLLNAWPAEGTLWWRLRETLFPSHVSKQDSSLRGWNWTPGTASWVEPTAHALLFLRSLPSALLSSQAAKRRHLGERMLF